MSLAQQTRLYAAEAVLWGHGRDFSCTREVADYLTDIMAAEWFVKRWPSLPTIEVFNLRTNKWAGCADRKSYAIYLRRRTEHVVLHELAHLLCSTDEHDMQFVEILCHLVRNAMGFYAWAEFVASLEKEDYYGA